MTTQPLHSRLLNAAARDVLQPLGLTQNGQSRFWIDDHGWWLIGVSFEPSSFTKGSYLSVDVNWLWTEEQGFRSHFGGRIHRQRGLFHRGGGDEFVTFESEEQFAAEAHRLAEMAADKVTRYRTLFPELAHIPDVLRGRGKGNLDDGAGGQRYAYHIAVAYGLLGKVPEAREFFDQARITNPTAAWHHTTNDVIDRLRRVLDERNVFHAAIQALVTARRQEFKLDPSRAAELPGPHI